MKRAALLLLAAALAAIALVRRRVPSYPDWHAYMADAEGDALEPDPYLERLR